MFLPLVLNLIITIAFIISSRNCKKEFYVFLPFRFSGIKKYHPSSMCYNQYTTTKIGLYIFNNDLKQYINPKSILNEYMPYKPQGVKP